MGTLTKRELMERVADLSGEKRALVKKIIQRFLDEIVEELSVGNRVEFRDFGVFDCKVRAARIAQNPKTLEQVSVAPKRIVKFKAGRVTKARLAREDYRFDHATGLPIDGAAPRPRSQAGA